MDPRTKPNTSQIVTNRAAFDYRKSHQQTQTSGAHLNNKQRLPPGIKTWTYALFTLEPLLYITHPL
uniref:Uncharacterized protein n=1 Tax=Strigamia maritima TaxID=126957 RepID=T1JFP6_STRMM